MAKKSRKTANSKVSPKARVAAQTPKKRRAQRIYLNAKNKLPVPLLAAVFSATIYALFKLANAIFAIISGKALSTLAYAASFFGSAIFAITFFWLAALLWNKNKTAYAYGIALSGATLVLEILLFYNLQAILPIFGLATYGTMLQAFYAATLGAITLQAVILWGVHASKQALDK